MPALTDRQRVSLIRAATLRNYVQPLSDRTEQGEAISAALARIAELEDHVNESQRTICTFANGERVYHRERDEYGTVIATYQHKTTDGSSTYVQLDDHGDDVFEVSTHFLERAVPQLDPHSKEYR